MTHKDRSKKTRHLIVTLLLVSYLDSITVWRLRAGKAPGKHWTGGCLAMGFFVGFLLDFWWFLLDFFYFCWIFDDFCWMFVAFLWDFCWMFEDFRILVWFFEDLGFFVWFEDFGIFCWIFDDFGWQTCRNPRKSAKTQEISRWFIFLESGLVAPSMKQNVRTHVAICLAIHFQKYLVGRVSCNKLRALTISKTVGIY